MRSSAHYNPATGRLHYGSVYEEFHEWAHLDQHVRRTLPWRLWERARGLPVAGRLAQLGLEIEAALLARATLRACRIWRPEDAREAWRGIAAYARALTVL